MTEPNSKVDDPHFFQLLGHWNDGFWGLLQFAMQMMLMLVLGHVLALTKPVRWVIDQSLVFCRDTASAALMVTLLTLVMAFLNWGLGLIFGAIFARKVGEYATRNGISINYALIGAAGYSGLLVWHGGFSGSAPLKIAEEGHQFFEISGAVLFPDTIGSVMNIVVTAVLLLVLPLGMFLLGRRSKGEVPNVHPDPVEFDMQQFDGPADKLDSSRILSLLFGGLILLTAFYIVFIRPDEFTWNFMNPNFINLVLFGCCLCLHPNVRAFINATGDAIKGSTGIMIQFPLYAGIMGILGGSGLIALFSNYFVEISNKTTFPIFTFFGAGVVNFFVPSGGGQWAVQGEIVLEASSALGVPFGKGVMALAYGDQLTNMMQPFWALPLLGITGLKAKDILPYTIFLMLLGTIVFVGGLVIF